MKMRCRSACRATARLGLPLLWLPCVWLAAPPTARGQVIAEPYRSEGITVNGKGEIKARPNFIELNMRTSAVAELTADAIVKYRDSKRRTLEAFEKLEMKELTVTERGLTLGPGNAQEQMQMAWRGMGGGGTAVKTQVEISSSLQLRLGGIRDLAPEQAMETVGKLLDTAHDAGAGVGPSQADYNMAYRYGNAVNMSMVKFVVRDLDELREQAYQAAVDDARKRAERLARLNGVRLGEVLAVNETYVSGDDATANYSPYYGYGYRPQPSDVDEPHIASDTFSPVTFQVRLTVKFAIAGPADKAATASTPAEAKPDSAAPDKPAEGGPADETKPADAPPAKP